jgi:Undecaprenyl-phosphate galactose phosphotransferase WbaP
MAGKFQVANGLTQSSINSGVRGLTARSVPFAAIQARVGLALLASDVVSFGLALALTLAVRALMIGHPSYPHEFSSNFWMMAVIAVPIIGLLVTSSALGHYQQRIPAAAERRHLLAGGGVMLLLGLGMMSVGANSEALAVVIGVWVTFPVLAILLRLVCRRVLDAAGLWRVPTLVVGHGEMALRTADALGTARGLGYEVVSTMSPWAFDANPDRFDWRGSMRKEHAQFVVLSHIPGTSAHVPLAESLVRERIPFAIIKGREVDDSVAGTHVFSLDEDLELHVVRNSLSRPVIRLAKIAFDVTLALLLLIVMLPVFLVIAVLVKRDGGPAFYAHRRVGANGRRFGCLKFRSMAVNADVLLERVLRESPERAAEWEATQKLRDDPRVTRIGAFLRKTSLDEIPQLINVLRLEMSLVGPRPIVESEMRHYGRDIAFYLQVRPGVTGLWQISGRSDTSYAERVMLDTSYVRSWSLVGDMVILAKTAPAVLARRGAH